jgi:hypothetical protein
MMKVAELRLLLAAHAAGDLSDAAFVAAVSR